MDNLEYEILLLKIADEVAKLVAVPKNRKHFEQHSHDLGKKHAAYLKALKLGAKQMPPEPLAGFLSVLAYNKNNPDEPPRPKIDETLAYYYFAIATIHDKMRNGAYTPIHNDSRAQQLAGTCVWPIIKNLCVDRRFIINAAFDYVKADLAEKQAKAENKGRLFIIGWLFEKMWYLIGAVIVSLIVAIVVDIFGDFGWLDQIKAFIYNILQLK